MESSLSVARNRNAANPVTNMNVLTGAALSDCRLLRALSAGWLTPQDLTVIVPFFAFQHDIVTRSTRAIQHLAKDITLVQSLEACERRLSEYDKILHVVGAARLSEETLPGFANYFSQRSLTIETLATRGTAAEICRVGLLILDYALSGLARALEKANSTILQFKPVVMSEAAAEETVSDTAGEMLKLHLDFLNEVYAMMRFERVRGISHRIQSRISLENKDNPPIAMHPGVGEIMCEERDDKHGVEFTVERYPCTAEVLDPRVVRIPPGKANNRHKHAHETLFYFMDGTGEILVGEKWTTVKPGDAVFSPRWAIHQTRNTGATELIFLAITDYYLTSQVYVGKYDKI